MTIVPTSGDGAATAHIGELRLRRYRTGELTGTAAEDIAQHTASCGQCRGRLRLLDEEQRQFEGEISFERFAGGVERAARHRRPRQRAPRRLFALGSLGFAAAAALLVVARPLTREPNRTKGTSVEAIIRVAPASGNQRAVAPGVVEALRAGERIRIGYRSDQARHLVAVSVDDAGEVTALYPEAGNSLSVGAARDTTYLPDSLEFTGAGRERVLLFLTERAVPVDEVKRAVRGAFDRSGGDLARLVPPSLDGRGNVQQFSWLFSKP